MKPLPGDWQNAMDIGHFSYVCGVRKGYRDDRQEGRIYICGGCNRPTYFEQLEMQTPAPVLGNAVDKLPEKIDLLYREARETTQVRAYTACVLVCRKILMHVAVEQGAEQNLKFIQYVEFLAKSGHIPPHGKGWVDHIRKKGNEANHEINIMSDDEALELLSFVEMLLKFVYEFPGRIMPKSEEA
jgi:hypothetical protein